MAWMQTGVTAGGNKKDFVGLSTEPHITTNVGDGSTVWLLDKGVGMIFSGTHTNPTTLDGWWEV